MLSCGLLYSLPSGENPEMVMKLRPQSRLFADRSGRPTWRFRLPAASWDTPAATRVYPNRTSLNSVADRLRRSPTMKFCARRGTFNPKPGTACEPGAGERLEEVAVTEAVARTVTVARARRRVVDACVELIAAVRAGGGRHEVLKRHRPVRLRIERRNGQPDRAQAISAGSGLPGTAAACTGSIGRAKRLCEKSPRALGERRNVGHERDAFTRARAFVVGEEEHAVPDDGTAEQSRRTDGAGSRGQARSSVRSSWWHRACDGGRTRTPCPKAVSARLRDDIDLARRVAAKRRVRRARDDLELLHGVHREGDAKRVQLGVDVQHAVQQIAVRVLASAVDVKREVAADRPGRPGCRRRRARRQQAQFEDTAAVERQPDNLTAIHQCVIRAERRRSADTAGAMTSTVSANVPSSRLTSARSSWLT